VYRFGSFQDVTRELNERRSYAKRTGCDMDIETGIVEVALEKETSLLYEIKLFAERKIGERIIDKEKAKTNNGYPEDHPGENFHRPAEGELTGVLHTVGVIVGMLLPKVFHNNGCYEIVKGGFRVVCYLEYCL
jgi:hypothetical protein